MPWIVSLLLALQAAPDLEAVRRHREAHAASILAEFVELLAIPNVASDLANIRRNSDRLCEAFQKRGVVTKLLTLDGVPPIVLGELRAPGATRTIGIYVHYDG